MSAKRGPAGFTLVELMIAVFVGALVIGSMYTIFVTSQRIFHEEGRVAQAQLGARIGLELLKSDLARAGYLSSPNPNPDPLTAGRNVDPLVCFNEGITTLNLHPVVHTNGVTGKIYNTSGALVDVPHAAYNVNLSPDAVVLVGNFINARTFLAQTIDVPAGTIQLQAIEPLPPPSLHPEGDAWVDQDPIGDNEFARMFPTTAFVRVVNRHGRMSFARITGTGGAASRTINVSPGSLKLVSDSIQCGIEGYGEGSEINVVNAVLYRIEVDPSPDNVDPSDATYPNKKTDLVRYMLDQSLGVIPETREVVIEYAVDFQVWYRQDDPVGATGPQPHIDMTWAGSLPEDDRIVIGVPLGTSPPPLDGSSGSHPENLRSAIIKVSVRTASEDPEFMFTMRPFGEPLFRFELNPNTMGAAHVRTLVTEVELPNIAFRNLRN